MTTTPPSAHDDAATVPELSTLLRRHGLRRTPSRLCTLRMLCTSGEHLSAAEIGTKLRQLGLPCDQATVYRTLETFADVGLAHAVHGPGNKRYGFSSQPHHHTVCEECGRVRDLAIEHMREAVERIIELTGLRTGASGSLLLYGLCAHCSE
ncbi:Fur family transcriptional regulator [Streptomyces sp. NPDC017248]|uniref:Fur family transcriptional regulator n=1 Tax=unclassified Streptomyces TaxID=2593676 RepID=UPI0037BD7DDA